MASYAPVSFMGSRTRTGSMSMHRRNDSGGSGSNPSTPHSQSSERSLSKSLMPVSNMQSLDDHFSSKRHDGWLHLNVLSAEEHSSRHRHDGAAAAAAAATVWQRYWFSLENGELNWFHTPADWDRFRDYGDKLYVGTVPLERVVKISMSSQHSDTLTITYHPKAVDEPAVIYNLRGQDRDDRNHWLHSFHRSVAWLVTAMTQQQLRAKSSSEGDNNNNKELFRPTGRSHTLGQADQLPSFAQLKHPRKKAPRPSDGFSLGGLGGGGGGGGGDGGSDPAGRSLRRGQGQGEAPAAGARGRAPGGAAPAPLYPRTGGGGGQQPPHGRPRPMEDLRRSMPMPCVVKERSVSGGSFGSYQDAGTEQFLSRNHGSCSGAAAAGAAGSVGSRGSHGSHGSYGSDDQADGMGQLIFARQLTIPRSASDQREAARAFPDELAPLHEDERVDVADAFRGFDGGGGGGGDDDDLPWEMDLEGSDGGDGRGRSRSAAGDRDFDDDDDDGSMFQMSGTLEDSTGSAPSHSQLQMLRRNVPMPAAADARAAPAAASATAPAPAPAPAAPAKGKYMPPWMKRKLQAEAAAGVGAPAAGSSAGRTAGKTAEAAAAAAQTAAAAAAAEKAAADKAAAAAAVEAAAVTTTPGNSALSGLCAIKGKRSKMEDRDVIVDDFSTITAGGAGGGAVALSPTGRERHSFYAVFDGHDGVQAAQFAADHICQYASTSPQFAADPMRAFVEAIRRIDNEFLAIADAARGTIFCGSTALTVYIRDGRVYTCTVGDSRCVLCRGGQAKELSVVLTPGTASERTRIEAAGGWVTEETELILARLHHMKLEDPLAQEKLKKKNYLNIVTHRVNGTLSVSRALGDPEYKGEVGSDIWSYPAGHSREFAADLVLSEPMVQEAELQPEDEFLILACDGLWDVLDGKDAVRIVQLQLAAGATPKVAAQFLVQQAMQLGTSDNVSVIVVPLRE